MKTWCLYISESYYEYIYFYVLKARSTCHLLNLTVIYGECFSVTTHWAHGVVATLIQRRNNVVSPVGIHVYLSCGVDVNLHTSVHYHWTAKGAKQYKPKRLGDAVKTHKDEGGSPRAI